MQNMGLLRNVKETVSIPRIVRRETAAGRGAVCFFLRIACHENQTHYEQKKSDHRPFCIHDPFRGL